MSAIFEGEFRRIDDIGKAECDSVPLEISNP